MLKSSIKAPLLDGICSLNQHEKNILDQEKVSCLCLSGEAERLWESSPFKYAGILENVLEAIKLGAESLLWDYTVS